MRIRSVLLALALASAPAMAMAHHSFAVFFDQDKQVSVQGVVKDFQFANPHGVLTLVANKNGQEELWRAETNAPVILRRLGWTKDSVKPGDKVTVEGWPAKDGTNYLRMRRVLRADGSVIGTPISGFGTQK